MRSAVVILATCAVFSLSGASFAQPALKWQANLPFEPQFYEGSDRPNSWSWGPDGTLYFVGHAVYTTNPITLHKVTPAGQVVPLASIAPTLGATNPVLYFAENRLWVWWEEPDLDGLDCSYFACVDQNGNLLFQSKGSSLEMTLRGHQPLFITPQGSLVTYSGPDTPGDGVSLPPTSIGLLTSAGALQSSMIFQTGWHRFSSLGPAGDVYGYEQVGSYRRPFRSSLTALLWKGDPIRFEHVVSDQFSNAYVIGGASGGLTVRKFGSSGQLIWEKTHTDPALQSTPEQDWTWETAHLRDSALWADSGVLAYRNVSKNAIEHPDFWFGSMVYRTPGESGDIARTAIALSGMTDLATDSVGAAYHLLLNENILGMSGPFEWRVSKGSSNGTEDWSVAPASFPVVVRPEGNRVHVSSLGHVRVLVGSRLLCYEQLAQPKPDNYSGGGSGALSSPYSVLGNDLFGWSGVPVLTQFPGKGMLFMRGNGRFHYAPGPLASNSQDSFEYSVKNLAGQSVSVKATVNVPPVAPGKVTALSLNTLKVTGGDQVIGTATFSEPASVSGMQVVLWTSNWLASSVAETKTIAQGKSLTKFPVQTVPVAVDTTVKITAARYGGKAEQSLTVLSPRLKNLVAPSQSLTAGSSMRGTVTLKGKAAKGGVIVSLKSNNALLTLPASVTVPEGSAGVSFNIKAGATASSVDVVVTAKVLESVRRLNVTIAP